MQISIGLLLLAFIGRAEGRPSAQRDIPEETRTELATAERTYRGELDQCAGGLLEEIAAVIDRTITDSKVDITTRAGRVRDLLVQETRFLLQGQMPDLPSLSAAVERSNKSVDQARADVGSVFERIAGVCVEQGDFAGARAVLAEKDRVLSFSTYEQPRGWMAVGFDDDLVTKLSAMLTGKTQLTPLPENLQPLERLLRSVTKEVARVRSDLQAKFDEYASVVLKEYDDQKTRIQFSTLDAERKLDRIDELEAEREAFKAADGDGNFPSWSASVARRHQTNRGKAIDQARSAVERLASGALPQSAELAHAILDVRDRWFAVPATPAVTSRKAQKAPPRRPSILGRNLLRNGDCQTRSSGNGIPDWEIVRGGWRPQPEDEDPDDFFFHPNTTEKSAELKQLIDVTLASNEIDAESVTVRLVGEVRSTPQRPGDQTQIMLLLRNADGELLDSRLTQINSFKVWTDEVLEAPVPASTRTIEVVLISTLRRGNSRQVQNNGYFDNLSVVIRQE